MKQFFSKKHSIVISSISLALLGFSLSGCAPLVVGGGAATAAVASTVSKERGFSGFWDDAKIKSEILWHYAREAEALTHQVEVVVRQGRVLLTGAVEQPLLRIEAVKLAWKVPGVQEVLDEISLENQETMASYTHDIWITTKVKSALFFEQDIHSTNYNVQTVNGVVYLMGIAPNTHELDKVLFLTRRINGIKEVVNLIQSGKLKKDKKGQKRS